MIPDMLNPLGIFPFSRRLEYITSASNRGLTTGFTFSGHKLGYELQIDPNNYAGSAANLIGNWNGTTRDIFLIINSGSSYEYYPFQAHIAQVGGTAGIINFQIPKGGFHTVSVLADDQTNTVNAMLDGTSVQSGTYAGSMFTGMAMTLRIYTWKIKRFKISQDDILVRDFIPVKDMQGNACMYDTVNQKYYQI